jgi:hypothetical protein
VFYTLYILYALLYTLLALPRHSFPYHSFFLSIASLEAFFLSLSRAVGAGVRAECVALRALAKLGCKEGA